MIRTLVLVCGLFLLAGCEKQLSINANSEAAPHGTPSDQGFLSQFERLKRLTGEYTALLEKNIDQVGLPNLEQITPLSIEIASTENLIVPNVADKNNQEICKAAIEDIFGMTKYFKDKQYQSYGISEDNVDQLKNSLVFAIFSCENRWQVQKIDSFEVADDYLVTDSIKKTGDGVTYESVRVGSFPFDITTAIAKVAYFKSVLNCQTKKIKLINYNYEDVDKETSLSEKQQGIYNYLCKSK